MEAIAEVMRRLHADKSDLRTYLHYDFQVGRHLVASDGGAMVMKYGTTDFEADCTLPEKVVETIHRTHAAFTQVQADEWRSFDELLNQPRLQQKVFCPHCDGFGWKRLEPCANCEGVSSSECSPGKKWNCHLCHGTDFMTISSTKTPKAFACNTCLGFGAMQKHRYHAFFSDLPVPASSWSNRTGIDSKYARLMALLPGAQWAAPRHLSDDQASPILVHFEGGWGAIMPLR